MPDFAQTELLLVGRRSGGLASAAKSPYCDCDPLPAVTNAEPITGIEHVSVDTQGCQSEAMSLSRGSLFPAPVIAPTTLCG